MFYDTESCIFCQASASLLSRIIKKSNIKTLRNDVNEINLSNKNKKILLKRKYKPFRKLFQQKYKERFITFMKVYNTRNLWSSYKSLSKKNQANKSLIKAMRHLDYTVNITWVMAHYNTAKFYIESKSGNSISTGGSDWHKYMHPKYQKRIFFPDLWSKDELEKWGENE